MQATVAGDGYGRRVLARCIARSHPSGGARAMYELVLTCVYCLRASAFVRDGESPALKQIN